MTVQSEVWRNEYISTGGTEYPYTFRILDASHLIVYSNAILKTLNSDYTVDGVGDAGGGTVTFVTAPTVGYSVVISRNIPLTQLTDFQENDNGLADTKEDVADKLTMLLQQQQERIERGPSLAPTSLYSNILLPDPEPGKVLEWQSVSALRNATPSVTGISVPISVINGGFGKDMSAENGPVIFAEGAATSDPYRRNAVEKMVFDDATSTSGTDSSSRLQDMIDELSDLGKPVVLQVSGSIRINNPVNLASNIVYDFRAATFYPGTGCSGLRMFYGNAITDFAVLGGKYRRATYSSSTTIGTGTYTDHVCFDIIGCARFFIDNPDVSGYWGSINAFDSTDFVIQRCHGLNNNAGLAIAAHNADVARFRLLYNTEIGCGDDAIAVVSKEHAYDVFDGWIIGNYGDKTRLDGSADAATGLRIQQIDSATGTLSGLIVAHNTFRDMVHGALVISDLAYSVIHDTKVFGYCRRTGQADAAILLGIGSSRACEQVYVTQSLVKDPTNTGSTGGIAIQTNGFVNGLIADSPELEGNRHGAGSIYLENTTGTRVLRNKASNSDATDDPGIQEVTGSDSNIITDNDVTDAGASVDAITGLHTNTTIHGNKGWVSRSVGISGNITSGTGIAHGMSMTPDAAIATIIGNGGTAVSVLTDSTNVTPYWAGGGNHYVSYQAWEVHDKG